MLNALLVYPEFPLSFWSARYALEFVGRKAAMPPLGLLTIAALFPPHWSLRLVDMNVELLTDEHLSWCDYVFCSAMTVQSDSFKRVVKLCNERGIPVIAGGPYATSSHDRISGVHHVVTGEVEDTLSEFLLALESRRAPYLWEPARDCTGRPRRPDMSRSPAPRYDLVDRRLYDSAALQFSRGCPWNCEFCDITNLFGRVPRTKTTAQVLGELQALYDANWRNSLFLVDDNFIGNKQRALNLVRALAVWQRERKYPFSFYTEATANLTEMPELLDGMVEAGFSMVFLGIETPSSSALLRAGKRQNVKTRDPDYLLKAVRMIQERGLEVSAGFILGLDGDDAQASQCQFEFIQRAGIPSAMVGLLTALRGTDLYERLNREGRLLKESSGDNLSLSLNFKPELDEKILLSSYKKEIAQLYERSLRNYFARCYTFLQTWKPRKFTMHRVSLIDILAFVKSLLRQTFSLQGPAYISFLAKVLMKQRKFFPDAVRLAIMGYHYEKITRQQLKVGDLNSFLETEINTLKQTLAMYATAGGQKAGEARVCLQKHLAKIQRVYDSANADIRPALHESLQSLQQFIQEHLVSTDRCLNLDVPRLRLD